MDIAEAPNYNLENAYVVPFNALTPAIKFDLSCDDCSEIETAILSYSGESIDFDLLNNMFDTTALAVEGNEMSSSGSVTFKLSDISVDLSDIDTSEFIFAIRNKGDRSYKYYKIGNSLANYYTHEYDCTTTTEFSGGFAIGDNCKIVLTFDPNTPNTGIASDAFATYDGAVVILKIFINDTEIFSDIGSGIGGALKINDGIDMLGFDVNAGTETSIANYDLNETLLGLVGDPTLWDDTILPTSTFDISEFNTAQINAKFVKNNCSEVSCSAEELAGIDFAATINSMIAYSGQYKANP